MFLKEIEATLIPWWLLALLLTGDHGVWRVPLLVIAGYIILAEIRYRFAVGESQTAGFKRMVRMPVAPWFLRLILWRRIQIPHGVKCYTLHVHGRPKNNKKFVLEMTRDMMLGAKEEAIYVGNTFYDIGLFAKRQLGDECVQIIDGTFFGRWVQTWKADMENWRIVKIHMKNSGIQVPKIFPLAPL